MKRLLLAAVIFAIAQGMVAPSLRRPDAGSKTTAGLARRFPGVANTLLLAGFQPLLVQYLWFDSEVALQQGRLLDAIGDLKVLQRVDSGNIDAALYLSWVFAFGLQERESSDTGRLDRIEDGLEILVEAAQRDPNDPRIPFQQGQILSAPWSWNQRLARAFRGRRGRTPAEAAARAFTRAAALAPGSAVIALFSGEAWRRLGWEQWRGGDLTTARESLQQAVRMLDEAAAPGSALPRDLARAWSAAVEGVGSRDAASLAAALGDLRDAIATIPPPEDGGSGVEEAMAWPMLRAAMDLGTAVSRDGTPRDALSLVGALHSMQALLAARAPAGPPPAPLGSWEADLEGALDAIEHREPGLAEAVAEIRRQRGR